MSLKGFLTLLVVAALLTAGWNFRPWRSIRHEPGILVKSSPAQTATLAKKLPDVRGWKLTPLAEYRLKARVLRTKKYRSGFGSDLVPVDVATGWGPMSDQAVLDKIEVTMSNRFFFYKSPGQLPLPQPVLQQSAANNHIISATPAVAKQVARLIPGQLVDMKGYLVNAAGPNGETWNSSLRRDDSGNGACEVFYVEEITVSDQPIDEPAPSVAAIARR